MMPSMASWQRFMKNIKSVLLDMARIIVLTKHAQQRTNKGTVANLCDQTKLGYDKRQLYPLLVSSRESDFVMDL